MALKLVNVNDMCIKSFDLVHITTCDHGDLPGNSILLQSSQNIKENDAYM